MRLRRAASVLMVLAILPACGGHAKKQELSAPSSSVQVAEAPSVNPGASPPVGLIWIIGFTENVPLSAMEAQYAKFVQLSQDLWAITEGQVFLSKVRFFDNVAPGAKASASESLQVPAVDALIYPAANWDVLPVTGEVIFFSPPGTLGRTNRRVDVPDDANRFTLIHEGSHFAWQLSWTGNNLPPGLDDEYNYGPDDPACVMDLRFVPVRWCSGGALPNPDHVTKNGGQGATSCWEQIKKDYPNFNFSGSSTTATPTPPLAVEYNDTP